MGKRKKLDGAKPTEGEPIIIKKYANRRLYNTATSSYVTLDDLSHMVKEDSDFVVQDAKTGEDITRPVLTQIIVEEESKGQNLLPVNFLRQLISFYGDNLQCLVPRYLDSTMENFTQNQEQMRQYLQDTLGGFFPFGKVEEMSKQNIVLLQQAMDMFAPFKFNVDGGAKPDEASDSDTSRNTSDNNTIDSASQKLNELERRMAELRKELGDLGGKGS